MHATLEPLCACVSARCCQADLADKAAVTAPKLGKLKYEPGPTAVLTSDEVTGSLRKLKACPLLASDRFKSLQRRGLIEPRKPALKRVGWVTRGSCTARRLCMRGTGGHAALRLQTRPTSKNNEWSVRTSSACCFDGTSCQGP